MTLWQNKRFKEENDKSQERLEKISKGQAKALEQILLMDQSSNVPLVDIKKSAKGDAYVNIELFIKKDCTAGSLKLFLTNITEYPIKDIHVHNLELFTYDLKYTLDESENCYDYNPHTGLPGHYDTHVGFKLLPHTCKEKNEYFEKIYSERISEATPRQNAEVFAKNKHFSLEITFEIRNIYGKRIIETIICEFHGAHSVNPYNNSFELWNKELRFEIAEESDNA